MFKFFRKICFVIITIISTHSQALDVQSFRPNFDQQGGIVVQNTKTMPRLKYAPGLFMNWVRNPIEFGTTGDARTDTLVGWFATVDLLFAAGITDDLTVGMDMPFNIDSNIEAISTTVPESSSNIGDLNLYAKYRLRKADDRKIIPAIGVLPFITLSTGDDAVFFGNNKPNGGFKLVFDWLLSDRHNLSVNMGPRFRETDTVLNLKVSHEFLASVGYNYLLSETRKLNLSVELFGSTTFSKFMSEEISSPFELLVGLQKRWMNDKLNSTFGIGRGGNNGYGSPDFRVFAGVSYLFGFEPKTKEEKPQLQPVQTPEQIQEWKQKIEVSRTIVFKTSSAEFNPVSLKELDSAVDSILPYVDQISKITIHGHTDSTGSEVKNMVLSQSRADAVKKYLVDKGIPAEKLDAVGHGGTQLKVSPEVTAADRATNRRVEFVVDQIVSGKTVN